MSLVSIISMRTYNEQMNIPLELKLINSNSLSRVFLHQSIPPCPRKLYT